MPPQKRAQGKQQDSEPPKTEETETETAPLSRYQLRKAGQRTRRHPERPSN